MEGSHAASRHRARFRDQVALAAGFSALLCAYFRLPSLFPEVSWVHRASRGVAQFVSQGHGVGYVVEWLAVALLLLAVQVGLGRFDQSRLRLTRPLSGIVASMVLVSMLGSATIGLGVRGLFAPVGLCALWVSASFGLGAGVVTALGSLALCALSGAGDVATVPLLIRAVCVVLFLQNGKSAQDGLRAGVVAGCIAGLSAVGQGFGGTLSLTAACSLVAYHAWGGLLEGALYSLTRGLGERLLGHVSRERLIALLDLSHPLLLRMVSHAPGSFEHSRTMANLAEQAASAVGADALLTRVGAYYHDLGKSVTPKFFVENLEAGERSAHEGLTPRQSAQHILAHVTSGVQILRDGGIPEPVVEFAYTHHGSQLVEYFLNKERTRCAEEGIPVENEHFRYPGMKPSTKETAILMLVDSIEAASRTLESFEREPIEDMVRRIVFAKLAAEQLDESGLTMQELRVISQRVVQTLVHMNHNRIKYPWQQKLEKQQKTVRPVLSVRPVPGPVPYATEGSHPVDSSVVRAS